MNHDYKVIGWAFASKSDREERDRQITEMRAELRSIHDIADHFGLTCRSVEKVIARHHYADGGSYCDPRLIARNEEIHRLRLDGLRVKDIAVVVGIHESVVRDVLAKMGVTIRVEHPKTAEIKALIAEGLSTTVIRKRLGVGGRTVDRIRRGEPAYEPREAIARSAVHVTDGPYPLVYPVHAASLVPTRFIDGFFNVEAADPALASYDAKPFNGGRYRKSPHVKMSGNSSPAQLCAMHG